MDETATARRARSRRPHHGRTRWLASGKSKSAKGYATPLVVANTVYCFTRRDGQEMLTALDSATGRQLWQSGYAAPYTPSNPAAAHGAGPKATPAFHDGRLFTLGVGGIVAAFDASSGKVLWRTPPPPEPPFFSAASSPIVSDGVVMVHPGDYGPLTAFDVRSGEIKWTAGDGGFFASPLIDTLAGTRQVITVTQSSVIGVSIADGRCCGGIRGPVAKAARCPSCTVRQ